MIVYALLNLLEYITHIGKKKNVKVYNVMGIQIILT